MLLAKKIWLGNVRAKDVYVDFKSTFDIQKKEKTKIDVSADGAFTLYVNGELAGFAVCTDYPHYKTYYSFDLSKFTHAGENELLISVWHEGVDSQTYLNANAFLAFNVYEGKKIVSTSDSSVLARKNVNYKNGYCKQITYQLGLSYFFDAAKANTRQFKSAREYGLAKIAVKKHKNLRMLRRVPYRLIETEKGYIIDLKREYVGFVEIDADFLKAQKLEIVFGENIRGGHLIQKIEDKDFSVEYAGKRGENRFIGTFRRVAGRYLEIFTKDIKIRYLGIRPVVLPVARRAVSFSDSVFGKIYSVCVHTLICCMHEHYEDGPWREQALYVLDGRNQMLAGYAAFKGYTFARENIVLMSKGVNKYGLLDLCFPAGINFPIPFFSLCYPLTVYEYVQHSGDKSILGETEKTIRGIMRAVEEHIDGSGLIPNFPYPFWNFYEWSEGSNHCTETGRKATDEYVKQYDLILNCAYILARKYCDLLFGESTDLSAMKKRVKDKFYNDEKGLYRLSYLDGRFSRFGNAIAILAEIDRAKEREVAENMLNCPEVIAATLSTNGFIYDALLKTGARYKEYILNDIKNKYEKMLKSGATTFWETEKGDSDFNGVGSLCHGWSALPAYYLSRLLKK